MMTPRPQHEGGSVWERLGPLAPGRPPSSARRAIAHGILATAERWLERDDHESFESITRRAARRCGALLRDAPDGRRRVDLELFVQAAGIAFVRALPVRQFRRESAHAIFALVESEYARRLLDRLRATAPSTTRWRHAQWPPDARPSDDAAALAVGVVLALAEQAASRPDELLGFTAAFVGALSVLQRHRRMLDPDRPAATRLRAAARSSQAAGGAVARGARLFEWCATLLEASHDDTLGALWDRAAAILEGKARYAMLHHGRQRLGGRALIDWFSDSPFAARSMLAALQRSRWIDPENIDASPFFGRLLGPGGRMEGVFFPDEIATLKRCLAGAPPPDPAPRPSAAITAIARTLSCGEADPPALPDPPRSPRGRFWWLLDRPSASAGYELARELVAAALAEAEASNIAARVPELAPFEHDPATLEARMMAIRHNQARLVETLELNLEEDELRTFHALFAPFALVDGCWLQSTAARATTWPQDVLRRIYIDEVGNGQHAQNHANVYARLLVELGVASSPDDRGFADALPAGAFKVANFLQALEIVAAEHEPELFGITLAIEMAGLDGLYDRMLSNLERYGYDASFWRLHISIDNYSTGHARQCQDAISHYLETVATSLGRSIADQVWLRVWRGFQAMFYLFGLELAVLRRAKRPAPSPPTPAGGER